MERDKKSAAGHPDQLDQLLKHGRVSPEKSAKQLSVNKDGLGWQEPQEYQFPAAAGVRGGQLPTAAKNALFHTSTTKAPEMPQMVVVKKKKPGLSGKEKALTPHAQQEQHQQDDGDDDSSSLVEERDQKPGISRIKKLELPKHHQDPATNSISIPATDQKDMVVEDDPLQGQYKRITSLDELYVEKNFLLKNKREPYHSFEPNKQTIVADIIEARYLPDTVNFVRMKGFFFSTQGGSETRLSPMVTSMMDLNGDVNQMEFNSVITLDKPKLEALDSVFLLLVWESFQDIFGDDEVEFSPLIFGFSLIKVFETDGMRSNAASVSLSISSRSGKQ